MRTSWLMVTLQDFITNVKFAVMEKYDRIRFFLSYGIYPPYYVMAHNKVPYTDYSREMIPPNTDDTFPDGAVGIRVDAGFWAIAALPWKEYKDVPLKDIVRKFWPDTMDDASFEPDVLPEHILIRKGDYITCLKEYQDDPEGYRRWPVPES